MTPEKLAKCRELAGMGKVEIPFNEWLKTIYYPQLSALESKYRNAPQQPGVYWVSAYYADPEYSQLTEEYNRRSGAGNCSLAGKVDGWGIGKLLEPIDVPPYYHESYENSAWGCRGGIGIFFPDVGTPEECVEAKIRLCLDHKKHLLAKMNGEVKAPKLIRAEHDFDVPGEAEETYDDDSPYDDPYGEEFYSDAA
jgi:hypothetical protein